MGLETGMALAGKCPLLKFDGGGNPKPLAPVPAPTPVNGSARYLKFEVPNVPSFCQIKTKTHKCKLKNLTKRNQKFPHPKPNQQARTSQKKQIKRTTIGIATEWNLANPSKGTLIKSFGKHSTSRLIPRSCNFQNQIRDDSTAQTKILIRNYHELKRAELTARKMSTKEGKKSNGMGKSRRLKRNGERRSTKNTNEYEIWRNKKKKVCFYSKLFELWNPLETEGLLATTHKNFFSFLSLDSIFLNFLKKIINIKWRRRFCFWIFFHGIIPLIRPKLKDTYLKWAP